MDVTPTPPATAATAATAAAIVAGGVARRDDRQLPLFDGSRREPAFEVRASRRARRLTVRVYPGGRVLVTVPQGTRPEHVQRFVARHREWIDARVAEFSLRAPPEPLPTHVHLRALGEDWVVRYDAGLRRAWSADAGGVVTIGGGTERPEHARAALRDWLLDQGYRGLAPWLGRVARDGGFDFARAQIRRQRTRWGSCSRRGTISLNVCLLFQPPPVVRYLFVHELAHTRHMNHSPRFWRLVEQHEPEWRTLDRELLQGWRHVPHWVYD